MNRKLEFFLWLIALMYVLWGFLNPLEFTLAKWGTSSPKDQYAILFMFFGIVLLRLIQIFLDIKKNKK
ncbi:hypothetical protein [Sulfurovum mangrovi]|uniref:hypothetical protein n=1 Tax=Sulfurovum mangrovi TaxID=2893889 RepID=UPI001E62C88F|nr:hypothetical protein [Sulfurovum mangrovi]UFH58580.1 hypothetical protein LN246_09480 [Sulfurovum mangrovi]